MTGAVMVFARAPEEGRVKTRLASYYGPGPTLRLYRAFLQDTFAAVRAAGAMLVLAHTPADPFPEQQAADHLVVQRGDGFGMRFDHALADTRALIGPGVPLVAVGADTPHLGPHRIQEALSHLETHDAVFGANDSEGFYLLGFRDAPVVLGGLIGRPEEAALVLSHLQGEGTVAQLPASFDLDGPADVARLFDLPEDAGWHPEESLKVIKELGDLAAAGPTWIPRDRP